MLLKNWDSILNIPIQFLIQGLGGLTVNELIKVSILRNAETVMKASKMRN
ncbi:hypothetical protein J1N35_042556 [Gossypium stocksii]|uniref:Uncharacterized protein n=1 Tax=Gossypium stocksii TaxID=47602 RepID=A0A9D3ZE27_9ROSI|nr:hypothetical protein J1N35_042556 [Gossypium stocksii]